jgi:hypothetical protein
MNCTKYCGGRFAVACVVLTGTLLATFSPAHATLIVDDSWADGGRTNGADPLDTGWWTSTASTAIEVSVGSLGLVTGSSGRGIHGTFTPQTLNVGDTLKASFTFTTPATIGSALSAAFKIGLFNTNGNAGLAADLSASSGTPNPIYNPLPGYMMDYDVVTGSENIQFREKDPVPGSTGQLLGTTTGFTSLAGGGSTYTFAANTTYTGVISATKTATGLDLTGSLSQGATLLSTFTTSDSTPSTSTFDLLAFHANASVFGSSNVVGAANNGIDFSNIKIELNSVPEPSAILLGIVTASVMGAYSIVRRFVIGRVA